MGEGLRLARALSFELLRTPWVGEALLLGRLGAGSGAALEGEAEEVEGARA